MKQWVKKIFLGALLIVGGTTAAMAASLDRIVAVVNDSVITQSQLNQQLRQTRAPITEKLRQQVLQHMIDVQL